MTPARSYDEARALALEAKAKAFEYDAQAAGFDDVLPEEREAKQAHCLGLAKDYRDMAEEHWSRVPGGRRATPDAANVSQPGAEASNG